jgi:hypothetical protein
MQQMIQYTIQRMKRLTIQLIFWQKERDTEIERLMHENALGRYIETDCVTSDGRGGVLFVLQLVVLRRGLSSRLPSGSSTTVN